MKKFLSVFSIVTILGLMTPAFAAPPSGPHGGHGGPHGGHGGRIEGRHYVSTRHHHPPMRGHINHRPPMHYHHHHASRIHVGGVLARRSYWNYPYSCDYRLGWCDDYYYPTRYYGSGVYVNLGIPIRF